MLSAPPHTPTSYSLGFIRTDLGPIAYRVYMIGKGVYFNGAYIRPAIYRAN